MAIQFEVKKDDARGRFEHEKRVLVEQINRYNCQLEEKKQMARDKTGTVEREPCDGMSQIERAFRKLLD